MNSFHAEDNLSRKVVMINNHLKRFGYSHSDSGKMLPQFFRVAG
jgi:hypothetical protein